MSSRFLAGMMHPRNTAKENAFFHINETFVFHKAHPSPECMVIVNSASDSTFSDPAITGRLD